MAKFTVQPKLSADFSKAFTFAHAHHLTQIRKQERYEVPYISHLMGVSGLVLEYGGNEGQAIAALLHDSIEDVGCTIHLLIDEFGMYVAGIVDELTEDKSLEKLARKLDYAERVLHMSDSALLVSFCDKLHNLRCYHESPELFGDVQRQFYEVLIPNYERRMPGKTHEMQLLLNTM